MPQVNSTGLRSKSARINLVQHYTTTSREHSPNPTTKTCKENINGIHNDGFMVTLELHLTSNLDHVRVHVFFT